MNNTNKDITQEQIQLLQQLRKSIINVQYEAYEDGNFSDLLSVLDVDLEKINGQIYDVIESKL